MSDLDEIRHLMLDLGFKISYFYRRIDGLIIIELTRVRNKCEEVDTELFCFDRSHPEYSKIIALVFHMPYECK